jgi:hypothetical protein
MGQRWEKAISNSACLNVTFDFQFFVIKYLWLSYCQFSMLLGTSDSNFL